MTGCQIVVFFIIQIIVIFNDLFLKISPINFNRKQRNPLSFIFYILIHQDTTILIVI